MVGREDADPDGITELDLAIERGRASFVQLGAAIFSSKEQFNPSATGRSLYKSYIQRLTQVFEKAHGYIACSFYCEHVIAAAVLTDWQQFWLIPPPVDAGSVPVSDLLFECERLNVEADRVLGEGHARSGDLKTTKMLVHEVVVNLLSLVDGKTPPPSRSILDLLRRELTRVHEYYRRAAERHAKLTISVEC